MDLLMAKVDLFTKEEVFIKVRLDIMLLKEKEFYLINLNSTDI